jgi:hypothetical protein
MELAGRYGIEPAEAPIAMDTEGLVVVAAVGVSPTTGMAALAVEIGLHAAAVPGTNLGDTLAHRDHLDTQFVTGDPGIGIEGHLAQVASEVRTADTDLVDANDGFSGAGRGGFVDVDDPE